MSDPGPTRSEAAYAEGSPFKPAAQEPLLNRAIPVSGELGRYRAPTAQRDVLAGITVAALAVPSAMAYGELAGVSPLAGLYALLLPTVAYLLLGSSRQVIIGPEGSISALVAVSILPLAAAGSEEAGELAAMLALLVGVLFLAAFLLRLGWMADYFSRPVLIGYIHGVAVVLVISQLGKMLGLDIDERDPLPQLWEVISELGDTQWTTLAVGAISLAVLLLSRLVMPRFPAALLVVVGAIAASWAFDLADRGVRFVGDAEGRPAAARSSRSLPRRHDPAPARPRSASSWSASPTRSSPPAPSPDGTTSTSARGRSCSPWAPRTWPPESLRESRSARAARAPQSTTRWARGRRWPGPSPRASCS